MLITNNNKKNLFVKLYLFRLFGLLGIDTVIEKFDYSFEIKKKTFVKMFNDIYNYFREKLNRCIVTDIAQNGDQKIFNFIVIELLKYMLL